MDATTEFTPLSSISVISRLRKDISKEQYARNQVYSVKNSATSGIQPQHRYLKEKSVSLKLKQYDDFFHSYDQVNQCGSGQKTWG